MLSDVVVTLRDEGSAADGATYRSTVTVRLTWARLPAASMAEYMMTCGLPGSV
jgi:hypothetical protein